MDGEARTKKLRYIQTYRDRHGKIRHAFRRRGHRSTTIKGEFGSTEFMTHYYQLLGEAPLPPASTMLGGVVAKRGADPNKMQPLIGVYLLMLNGCIVYIGESLHMPKRVAAHRKNGRVFDHAFYIPTMANERSQLEQTLIAAINPEQNRAHRTNRGKAPAANHHIMT